MFMKTNDAQRERHPSSILALREREPLKTNATCLPQKPLSVSRHAIALTLIAQLATGAQSTTEVKLKKRPPQTNPPQTTCPKTASAPETLAKLCYIKSSCKVQKGSLILLHALAIWNQFLFFLITDAPQNTVGMAITYYSPNTGASLLINSDRKLLELYLHK